ncbi:MAG: hypothetical protein ACYS6I_03505 [Planctomycetota bacterium]|jgi:competence protein ComGC
MMKPRQKGFVKYEMIIATLFVAVMTACMAFVMSKKLQGAKGAACDRNARMIVRQLKIWQAEKGTYPRSHSELERFMKELIADGELICPVTGTNQSYTIDQATHEVRCEHWNQAKPK